MKATLYVAAVLAVLVPLSANATTLGYNIATTDGNTTYTYTLNNDEEYDYLISLHVYAPISPSAILGGACEGNWVFDIGIDEETGCADIFWISPDPETSKLGPGESIICSLTVPSVTGVCTDYILPGCMGNWGYESYYYQELGAFIDMPSVPVPMGLATAAVPEPGSIVALILGLGCLVPRRRKR